jgi:hypothetical protein
MNIYSYIISVAKSTGRISVKENFSRGGDGMDLMRNLRYNILFP